ncbi:HAMP domain-containing histidine kinase [Alkalicella caledoniensis]|uniref:histidine kinase n=1 Tax=Alkalicella caledoniensis TaxID=2731377 RepID=A0A7G9W5V7_ALKCA|nr:HAMP domain-containing sensor histidine kinase [Alkalicella caledoniensis]QNO14069.1 HAMP domain-containing histidine kinase [Alkalicella caledoniensis]
MKIRNQLWIIFTSVFLIISIAVYIVVENMYEQSLQGGYEQIAITQGSTILDRLVETYPDTPNRSIGYLEVYGEQLNTRLIMLDHERRVYADGFRQLDLGTQLNLDMVTQNFEMGSIFSEADYSYIQYTMLPFENLGRQGYLLMVQESEQLYTDIKIFRDWMVKVLITAILAFFFISYLVASWFSKPIRQMITHLKKITPEKRTFSMRYKRKDEIKDLIDTTENMVEQLNLYDDRQRRFLSTSSHELKTPLATMQLIIGNLPYVGDDKDTFNEFVQDLSFQVEKMKNMVDQLLQINRMWDSHLQKEQIATGDIQDYIVQSFQHIAQNKDIKIEFDVDEVKLYVDRTFFLRGIENLVSNAIRYSSKGKKVEIKVKREKDVNKISVCDQGIGISPENLPHIFEPFYRANDATAYNQEGSGLGLTIVKQMIDMHKGKVEIETKLGQGTCVHLLLPTM